MSAPAKVTLTQVVKGNAQGLFDLASLGFEPADVVESINQGATQVVVREGLPFTPFGRPNADVDERGNVRVVWEGMTAERVAEHRKATLEGIAALTRAELAEIHDTYGIDLTWMLASAPPASKRASGDFPGWELGRTYVNGDDSMTYAAPVQFVCDGITFTSASAAARYVAGKRDGFAAGEDAPKYSRNGKTFWS